MGDTQVIQIADRWSRRGKRYGWADCFPIVGVGASAGGIEALEGFFRGVPEEPGFAVVIVTHLNPARESILHEIIARYTKLTGRGRCPRGRRRTEPRLRASVRRHIEHRRSRLAVTKLESGQRERKPIDVFFSALALDIGEYAAGAVLSGADGDGTLGIKAIKERGGLTLAQIHDGYGPGHPSMPDSAISGGFVDFAVPAEDMGSKLVAFAKGLALLDGLEAEGRVDGEKPSFEAERVEIYAILRNQVGHDFSGYKTKTFLRRVQRRVQVLQLQTVEAYVARLRQDPAEAQSLFRDLLINVTNFFRDADAFDHLARLVIPRLFEGRGADDSVRVWVPGCATGEEVYSVAILMREHMDTLTVVPRVQIFATDIDEHALAIARAGRYPAALLDSVPYARRRRFFLSDGGAYVLTKDVRELCVFSPHSVIRDPPFSRIDLVSCRNLLIYFGYDMQGQVIPTFHYALRPGGYLFLGTSENISQYRELFSPVEKKSRIYRSRDDVAPSYRLPLAVRGWRSSAATESGQRATSSALSLRQLVQTQVLEQFAPAHVVANREGDVVYYSTRTGKYLEAAPGVPTRHLITMARRGLRLDLRTAFREAIETNSTVTRAGIAVEFEDSRIQLVTLTVQPVPDTEQEPLYLVLFTDEGVMLSRDGAAARITQQHTGISVQLEHELRETRDRLQSLVEEYETALEELKSSNEELQSVNEELQSSNEELEASKEELQSVNEELHTVNSELSAKVDALDHANSDLQNLFNATNVATVFLDRDLHIRTFTPAVGRLFNIRPSDRGRPITDLSGPLNMPDLAADVATIMQGTPHIERQISRSDELGHFLVQFAPYRNVGKVVEGVVVTFVDVTRLTRAEVRLQIMVADLQQRTRNLLGVVQAIARQTLGKGSALDAFRDRLSALGRVQGLINRAEAETVDLRELLLLEVRAHLAPGESAEPDQVTMTGPAVVLRLGRVQAVALAVHELATNAMKYGALRNVGGKLAVEWQVAGPADQQILHIHWQETGVPLPSGSAGTDGLGMQLIKRSLGSALRAETEVNFGSDGLCMPLRHPAGTRRGPGPGSVGPGVMEPAGGHGLHRRIVTRREAGCRSET